MSAGVGQFCSWATPVALLLAGVSAVVLAVGIHAEDRTMSLLAAPLFVTFSILGAVFLVGLGWLGVAA